MTIETDAGKEAVADHLFGNYIDAIAIGTGTTAESADDTELAEEIYRADTSTAIVNFVASGDSATPGRYEAIIAVTGGDEVPAGTTITEAGVFANDGTLIIRDTYGAQTADAGHTVELTTPLYPPGGG